MKQLLIELFILLLPILLFLIGMSQFNQPNKQNLSGVTVIQITA